ncbi:HpcH/HpaI aldolase/citrate lyase family protein [Natronosalvus halobius]|uniref:HpcH/HpaI aldolase/citrate lyase family protein n=1 Tax=Natronosalvus halobius TaxID=2953746 RepID=UPI0020A170A5|nr:CoA ester lyase [Natronosalvus halobius]USZ73344.1 CoA ester lyase [Natronosalvus halobius]
MTRRSVLFTPGDRPEMLRKAPTAGADVLVFDLEDAVSPARTHEARTIVRDVLTDPEFDPDCEVCVRVNATPDQARADLESVLGDDANGELRLDTIMQPKVESAADVDHLAGVLSKHDAAVPILALIETAGGVLNAPDIAAAAATDALVFGAEDLSADIGATRTDEGLEVLYARERVVIAAAANGIDAIDTVYTDFGDERGLVEETEFAIQLGYDGKMAIHPAQVGPINDAFTPEPTDVEWAEAVLEGKREADADGRGVFEVDGQMIDAPLIAQAERILERAEAAADSAAGGE